MKLSNIVSGERRQELLYLARFVLVGISNTLLSYCIYSLLVYCGISWKIASPVSYAAGLINSFILNKHWTFRDRSSNSFRQMSSFLIINLLSWGCSYAMLALLMRLAFFSEYIAQIPAMVISTLVNFLGNRYWVFLKQKK